MEKEIIEKIEKIIDVAERHKSSYFMYTPLRAADRRKYEKENTCEEVTWNDGGDVYTAEYTVKCTCGNMYANGYYTKNVKKTTLTAIRNSFERITENEYSDEKKEFRKISAELHPLKWAALKAQWEKFLQSLKEGKAVNATITCDAYVQEVRMRGYDGTASKWQEQYKKIQTK